VFTSLTTLMKIPLVTTDGEEHQVSSLLFHDRSWCICFLVVNGPRTGVLVFSRIS
jgi:hypothetical protein